MQVLSIFRHPEVFDPEFLPSEDMVVHREKEIREIAYAIQSFLQGMPPLHLYLYGKPATGKTTVARLVLEKAEEFPRAGNIAIPACVYVNMRNASTPVKFAESVCYQLGIPIPGDKWFHNLCDHVFGRLSNTAEGKMKPFIIVMDEVHSMPAKHRRHILEVFLSPSSFSPHYSCIRTLVIAVASGEPAFLPPGLLSRLSPMRLHFSEYTTEQKFDILKLRCLQGFGKNIIEDGLIQLVAARSSDLRHALSVLLAAGQNCEMRGDTRITEEDVEQALSNVQPDWRIAIDSLSEFEEFLYQTVKKKNGATTREIHMHCQHMGFNITLRWVEKKLAQLELLGLLRSEYVALKGRGRAKRWYALIEA